MSKNQLNKSLTDKNITSVRDQIHLKKGWKPYFGTQQNSKSIVTDIDHFPYTRFFRGVYYSSNPVVFEREAGWRPTRNSCYGPINCNTDSPYPNHCFESACSTVYPCYPQYLQKISDRDALNVQLNRACIVQYR